MRCLVDVAVCVCLRVALLWQFVVFAFARGLPRGRGRAWHSRPPSVGHGCSSPPMRSMLLPQLGSASARGTLRFRSSTQAQGFQSLVPKP